MPRQRPEAQRPGRADPGPHHALTPISAGVATRVVRWSGPPAVVRVKTRADLIVAIPSKLPRREVLDLASLVLSGREYRELPHKIEHAQASAPDRTGNSH